MHLSPSFAVPLDRSFKNLKGNAQVCATTVGMGQNMLLADRSAMDHIVEAIRKIKGHSAELAKKA